MQEVIEANAKLSTPRTKCIVGRDRLCAAKDHARLQMVLQVLTDACQRLDNVNAKTSEEVGWSDAGKLQKLRRLDCPGRENHFASCVGDDFPSATSIDNAASASTFERDSRRMRIRLY